MHLDMITMSTVDITVTTVLGLVLLFAWLRERSARLVGWWGLHPDEVVAAPVVQTIIRPAPRQRRGNSLRLRHGGEALVSA